MGSMIVHEAEKDWIRGHTSTIIPVIRSSRSISAESIKTKIVGSELLKHAGDEREGGIARRQVVLY